MRDESAHPAPSGPRIALLGMYGGFSQEYNPGSFALGYVTAAELRRRLPAARIDLYSRDIFADYDHLSVDEEAGLTLRFFPTAWKERMLTEILPGYDGVVVGGDVVWGDGGPDEDVFFLDDERFASSTRPAVAFNVVHSWLRTADLAAPQLVRRRPWHPEATVLTDHRRRLLGACRRARYVAVRTAHLRELLTDLGVEGVVEVPDPVFLLDPAVLPEPDLPPLRRSGRPLLGISASAFLSNVLRAALRSVDLSGFDVLVYPFSRQHLHLETVLRLKKEHGGELQFLERYPGPLEALSLVGKLDVSLNSTLHGTIAAMIQGVPFVTFDSEDPAVSRKCHLLRRFGLEGRILRLSGDFERDVRTIVEGLPRLLAERPVASERALASARGAVRQHFDALAAALTGAPAGP